MKICPKCQNQMDDSAVFCTACGAQYVSPEPQNTANQEPHQPNNTNNANNNGAVPPPVQPYAQPYVPYDPFDHTAEFDKKDIADNKLYAMLIYLLGSTGIIIALLAAKDSPYVKFHLKQGIKFLIVTMILSLIMVVLFWTFIVPIIGGVLIMALTVMQVICFCQVCSGKAKEPALIRSLKFLK